MECISLCEIMETIHQIEPNFSEAIERIKEAAEFKTCERLYMGSSFCGQYFLHLSEKLLEELTAVCRTQGIKVTLVVPIFTERYLIEGKQKLDKLLQAFDEIIDEITVNDYGMLVYIHEQYKNKALNMGRLFMKDYREPRYEAYFNMTLKPKGFTSQLKSFVQKYGVKAIEFDPTHKSIDFSEKPEGIGICIYAPYAYITVGQICEVSGISKPIEKKFRPNEPCGTECHKYRMHYSIQEERDWRRIGRAIYFENRSPQIMGVDRIREIYAPLDWEAE